MTAVGAGFDSEGIEQKGKRAHGHGQQVVIVEGGGYKWDKW